MDPSPDMLLEETPAQRWRRRAIRTAIRALFALAAYALVVVAARALHRRVVYQPPSDVPTAMPDGATLLTARAADGATARAIEFPPDDVPRIDGKPAPQGKASKPPRAIVHFHGNAETADDNAGLAHTLARRGFSVVLVEYRGYGRSRDASPTEEGLYLDAAAILDALAARGIGPDRVVLWGQSLGTGVAAEMARRGRGSRLVLLAPFTSTVDLARRAVPLLPMSLVMVDRFDTLSKAPSIDAPAIVVHGDIDDVIPVEHGERVSRALPHATFIEVPQGRHDNLYRSPGVLPALLAHAGG